MKKIKVTKSRKFKNDSESQSFRISPSRWISLANAKEFVSKKEKNFY